MLERAYQWPPDYIGVLERRQSMLRKWRKNPSLIRGARAFYAKYADAFTEDWVDTFDPRVAGSGRPARVPFVLFPRQREFFEFLQGLLDNQVNGLVEKSRDMGATWGAGSFSVSKFLFVRGASIGWGSRKEMLVDRGGDMDSIFEKMRYIINSIPTELYPRGFDPDRDMPHMKIVSRETESSITGESGDAIGRGGRKLIYFKDESAHYERPKKIESALMDNTNCQVDMSSVHGLGNVFHRKREVGVEWYPGEPFLRTRTNVFIMDWRDHPMKNEAWYRAREQKAIDEGLEAEFRQEVDRNYAASIEGTIVPLAWIKSAVDFHLKVPDLKLDEGGWMAGLDIADGGGDRNAYVARKGLVVREADEWGERDVGETTRRAVGRARMTLPITVNYDSVGIGAGVKAEVNRLHDINEMPDGVKFVAWNAGASVQNPEGYVVEVLAGDEDTAPPMNKDFFYNMKAQGWWSLRRRYERVHNWVTKGIQCDPEDCISIDSRIPRILDLEKQVAQPVSKQSPGKLKLLVDKNPPGTKSPNMGDAEMQCFFPVEDGLAYDASLSWVG